MTTAGYAEQARGLGSLSETHLRRRGILFTDEFALYETTGKHLAKGGMGDLFMLNRFDPQTGEQEDVVGKLFQPEYLYQLRTDRMTRDDHARNLRAIERIAALVHPNLLPIYVSQPIADNHLTVAPHRGTTLSSVVAEDNLPARDRVRLLLEAARGLQAMHDAGLLHRDVTLRNILVWNGRALLFDFDLALLVDDVAGYTYRDLYHGRILGSPGYSVPPETLDAQLMAAPVHPALDIYALGGALFGLFTDALPCGETEDMWGLYLRIADGIVCDGQSAINYPNDVPRALRPVIERCLERDPRQRYPTVLEFETATLAALDRLPTRIAAQASFRHTLRYGYGSVDTAARLDEVYDNRHDLSVTRAVIENGDSALSRYGYQIQRSLGRVKGHPIFVAAPVPMLLASGKFPDANTYPKIVTTVDLNAVANPGEFVDLWLGGFLPILRSVRQGMLTALFRAVHDSDANCLLLFSEYVDDPRFGTDLDGIELSVEEALGLAYLVARQVRSLHRRGLAHNNVSASSLLLKGIRESHRVVPAMLGLVEPSFAPKAMEGDVCALADLCLQWIPPNRMSATELRTRHKLQELCHYLLRLQSAAAGTPAAIEELVATLGVGLATIDPNFSVLATYGGDLDAYALLLIQHRLFSRLW
jgi:hypothetical protein